jgi:hypothetical protein
LPVNAQVTTTAQRAERANTASIAQKKVAPAGLRKGSRKVARPMNHVIRFLAVSLICFVSTAFADDLLVIKDSDASNHIGEQVEVRGTVSSVHTSRKDNSFLNIGGAYPNQTFTGFIKAGTDLSLDAEFIKSLQGKEIGIVGNVQLYKGKPEIVVTEKEQIKIAE